MENGQDRERFVSAAQLNRLADWSMRKPVIALMGEFSAGKSTLMNLLIGQNILPTQVTATRMPPVWLRYGEGEPYLVDHAGNHHPVDLSDQASIPLANTSYIRLFCKAEILQHCDLIDTPGISDPNIKVENWIRTIRYANAVMWCTHAGQAWRESERGAWEALPKRLRQTSILLVTRKDKITSELDRRKIERRLERETQSLFNARMFISLTNAIKARQSGDTGGWADSGAQDFSEMLSKIVEGVSVQRSFLMARYTLGTALADAAAPVADRAPIIAEAVPAAASGTIHEIRPTVVELPVGLIPTVPSESDLSGADLAGVLSQKEAAPQPDEAAVARPAPETTGDDLSLGWAPKPKVDLNSYRLKTPVTEKPDSEAMRRVDLNSYRLIDPALRPSLAADNAVIAINGDIKSDSDQPKVVDDAGDIGVTVGISQNNRQNEVDRIREIWEQLKQQYDIWQTPSLVAAFGQLLGENGLNDRKEAQRRVSIR
ncbi:hypothetical protein HOY34_04100 [Xinfangfangia sp. D13-10-4-6]|uniref:dynamin family protein n=1 Tax=Pseudogemmobacter hezensis TaxID=2737662 RepID=UPI001557B7AC|nr:dynamin family protein [Pseudogemmobacter hezensis]NPD14381.1 hypothetical protein [Pseudogemmobacter hezensis]